MTHDTDMIRLYLRTGTQTLPCNAVGLAWPPPERLYMKPDGLRAAKDGDDEDFVLIRTACSELDDETAGHPHIARGAEYRYARELAA